VLSRPILLADGVSWRTPDGRPILDGVSVALHREKTGLVGANGSGKTRLLRVLSGELAPAAGSVRRAGSLAVLPQDFRALAGGAVAQTLGVAEAVGLGEADALFVTGLLDVLLGE
jgi:ATPase subunit of ABC transporter with duplicated ATPase domains